MTSLKERLRNAAVEFAAAEKTLADAKLRYEALYCEVVESGRKLLAPAPVEEPPKACRPKGLYENRLPFKILSFMTAHREPVNESMLATSLSADVGSIHSAIYALRARKLVERSGRSWIVREGSATTT